MSRHIAVHFLAIFVVLGLWTAPGMNLVSHAYAAKAKAASAVETEKDPNAPHPDFEYMDLKPLILPIITDRGLTQQVSLIISVEIPYGKMDEVKPFEPRLADAYLQDLYGALGTGTGMMMRGNVVDVVAIKQRLSAVSTKILGEEKFHDVLLQVVQQRPM